MKTPPSKLHRWGEPDSAGVRACNNAGCSVRVADSFRRWQPTKGARWRTWNRELLPECVGTAPPLKPTPATGHAVPAQTSCDYLLGSGRTCSKRVAGPKERRCIAHGGMPGKWDASSEV